MKEMVVLREGKWVEVVDLAGEEEEETERAKHNEYKSYIC